jgi:hypothetical protein
MLHVGAQLFRTGDFAQLFFPLPLGPRRIGGVAGEGLIVGGNSWGTVETGEGQGHGAEGGESDGRAAIHVSSPEGAAILPQEARVGKAEKQSIQHRKYF